MYKFIGICVLLLLVMKFIDKVLEVKLMLLIWVYLVCYFDKFLLFVISNGLILYMICSLCNIYVICL